MKDFDKKYLITQANSLVEARYGITKNEQLILCAMMSFINPDDSDFLTYRTSITQFLNLLGVDRKSGKREMENVVKRLLSRVLQIETEHGWKMFQWVSYAEVNTEEDSLLLRFHHELKPYLLELNGRFTRLKLQEVVKLKSVYSIRMYQILKDYYGQGQQKFSYSLEDYRQILLGSKTKKYPSFKYFRMKVLNVAQRELNEKSNLSFTFTTIRVGRKIGRIEFQIVQLRQDAVQDTAQDSLPQISFDQVAPEETIEYQEMMELGIQPAQAISWLKECNNQYLREKISFIKEERAQGRIKSSVSGFLAAAINGNYKNEQQLEKERQEKERQRRQEDERRKKKKQLTNNFSVEFEKQAKEKFLDSLSEDEQQLLLEDVLEKTSLISIIWNKIKEDGLHSPFAFGYFVDKIANFKEDKARYVAEKLKEAGFVE